MKDPVFIQSLTTILVAVISGVFGLLIARSQSPQKQSQQAPSIALPSGVLIPKRSRKIQYVWFFAFAILGVLFYWGYWIIKSSGALSSPIPTQIPVTVIANTQQTPSITVAPTEQLSNSIAANSEITAENVQYLKIVKTLPYDGLSYQISLSPDNSLIAMAGESFEKIRVWQLDDGHLVQVLDGYRGAMFLPRDRKIALQFDDNNVQIWYADVWKQQMTIQGDMWGCGDFSLDGEMFVSPPPYPNGGIEIWSVSFGLMKEAIGGDVSYLCPVAVSPDKHSVAAFFENYILVWNVDDGTVLAKLESPPSIEVNDIAFSPDSRLLVTVGRNGFTVWDLGITIESQTETKIGDVVYSDVVSCHGGDADSIHFSKDGSLVGFNSGCANVDLYRTYTWEKLQSLGQQVYSWAFSLDGTIIATATGDNNLISIWKVQP